MFPYPNPTARLKASFSFFLVPDGDGWETFVYANKTTAYPSVLLFFFGLYQPVCSVDEYI
jgi:hypothetical protein